MKFKDAFIYELKRRLRKIDLIVFFIIALVSFLLVQDSKIKYLDTLENKKLFQEIEKKKVEQYYNYTLYGGYGITIFFVPSHFSILYNDFVFDELLSNINTGDKLKIYKPIKGKNFFSDNSGLINFAGFILFFGSFFALIYGHDTTKNKDYLKFFSSISSLKNFLLIALTRIIILNLVFLLLIGISLISLLIDKINLFQPPLIYVVINGMFLISFFSSIGCIIGTIKKGTIRIIVLIVFYVISIIFIPLLNIKYNQLKANEIELLSKFELSNLKLIADAERKASKEIGIYKSNGDIAPEKFLRKVKEILDKKFEIIFKREGEMKNKILKKIKEHQRVSSFFPVLFFISVTKEVSSNGGLSYIDFYSYSILIKKQFIHFYVEKEFLNKRKFGEVENFIKGDENLYFAKSRLPANFWVGITVTILLNIISLLVSYLNLKRQLKGKGVKLDDYKLNIDIQTGKFNYFLTGNQTLKDYAYHFFSDKTLKIPMIKLDGEEIKEKNCIYLPNQKEFKGIKNAALYRLLFKRSPKDGNLKDKDKKVWQILFDFALKEPERIIIFDDFFKGLKNKEIEMIKDTIQKKGIKSLYISDDFYLCINIADTYFFSIKDNTIDHIKGFNDRLKTKG